MGVAASIERKLTEAFAPVRLRVEDESARHAGHSGSRPEGETHFRVEIVSRAFADKSRIERSRMVHAALAEELEGGVHALSMRIAAPDEIGDGGV